MNQLPPCLLQSVVLQRERGERAEGREGGAEGREGRAEGREGRGVGREGREGRDEEATLRGQEDEFEGP